MLVETRFSLLTSCLYWLLQKSVRMRTKFRNERELQYNNSIVSILLKGRISIKNSLYNLDYVKKVAYTVLIVLKE